MKVFFSAEYAVAGHAFDTTRKAAWVAGSLADRPIDGVELTEPRPATAAELETVHDPDHVRAVRTGRPRGLAESQGFAWDPGLWRVFLERVTAKLGDSVFTLGSCSIPLDDYAYA